jgi:dTDP-4-amino-4,6-dideoxygalactose transaminase
MAAHLEKPYASKKVRLPKTELTAANTLQLPMHSGLTEGQQRKVLEVIDTVTGSRLVS